MTTEDYLQCSRICEKVPGYSGTIHYGFFKGLLSDPSINNLLILGVYHGRDICFMLDILKRHHPGRTFRIVGVDKFSDTPCADWAPESKTKTWQEAGYGRPPSLEDAIRNTSPLEDAAHVELYQSNDEDFLLGEAHPFDVAYLDTSHDAATLTRQLRQIRPWLHENSVLCGDDFRDIGTWGVVTAVRGAFTCYTVYYDYIWKADSRHLK